VVVKSDPLEMASGYQQVWNYSVMLLKKPYSSEKRHKEWEKKDEKP
jgi:hypothetical protein